MAVIGQWVGARYQWPCAGCGSVLEGHQPPAGDEAERCLCCRAAWLVRELCEENARLRRELDAAHREHALADETIMELQAMLRRAHCEPTEPPPPQEAA